MASGARVLLVRVQSAGHHVGLTRVSLNGDGAFCAVTFVTGGNLARHETHIRLLGEGARADVHGAILGHGTMHADMTSQLHHETANTDSLTTLHAVWTMPHKVCFREKLWSRAMPSMLMPSNSRAP